MKERLLFGSQKVLREISHFPSNVEMASNTLKYSEMHKVSHNYSKLFLSNFSILLNFLSKYIFHANLVYISFPSWASDEAQQAETPPSPSNG